MAMESVWRLNACACGLFAFFSSTILWAQPESEYRSDARQQPLELLQHAQAFVEAHPDSADAPRAALDWLMAASVLKDEVQIKAARTKLLLHYSDRVAGRYVAATLENAKELQDLLLDEFTRPDQNLTNDFLRRFAGAYLLNRESNKGPAKPDESFMIAVLFAAQEGLQRTREETLESLKGIELKPKNEAIADVLFRQQLSKAERFVKLQAWHDQSVAAAIQRAIFLRLSQRERRETAITLIRIEQLLGDYRFTEALPLLEQLAEDARDARIRVWHGWALAATGDFASAEKMLQPFETDDFADPWLKVAAELRNSLLTAETALRDHAAAIQRVYSKLRESPPDAVEFRIDVRDKAANTTATLYVAADSAVPFFEVQVATENRMRLAYRGQGSSAASYAEGSEHIAVFRKANWMPRVGIKLDDSHVRFNFWMNSDIKLDVKGTIADILKAPQTADENAIRKRWGARGDIYLPAIKHEGLVEYQWLRPLVNEPGFHREKIVITDNDEVVSWAMPEYSYSGIRYGKTGELNFSPQTWPKLPAKVFDEFEFGELAKLYQAFFNWIQPKEPQQAAKQPAVPLR